ncbi:glycosyltransferase family 2 protein [Sphingomonas dokdonensis]|uniref:PGL/p-HBAD biosynthesis glycosyltransferase n=1 Tax=Sphingomonas dokdonensis TaxID=344880 RepID=A0A2D0A4L7_9SPHN|nr:glycosyltransferase family 2 protein [Sphingomonas dokdonensis]OWK27836.1 PGL/p-HBAD biosynthesis glycosyltransferase [Sphingomonas dokdonensis]
MKITVVTVCYNAAQTIADTLQSVAAQRGVEVEHVVIDGGSTDDTLAIVSRFPHVATVVSEPDKGIYDAMNKGLARATGDVIGFLNADDWFCRDDALQLVATHLADAEAVVGDLVIVDTDNTKRVRRFYSSRGFRPWMLRMGHMPPHPTLYVRREVFDELGGFDASYRIAGDFDFTVRLLLQRRATRWRRVPHTLVAFRNGGASTRNLSAKVRMNREILHSLRAKGLSLTALALYARYPFKALQLIARPR